MASVNKVILIGNLGSDPELRYTPQGSAVANFSVATNEVWTNKEGKKEERTEWHKIVVWGKQAETCNTYLKKGKQVYIEGSIRQRSWEDKEGNKRYTTEIIAQSIKFLGRAEGATAQTQKEDVPASFDEVFASTTPTKDEDVPF